MAIGRAFSRQRSHDFGFEGKMLKTFLDFTLFSYDASRSCRGWNELRGKIDLLLMDRKDERHLQEKKWLALPTESADRVRSVLKSVSERRMLLRVLQWRNAPDQTLRALYDVFKRAGRAQELMRDTVELELEHVCDNHTLILRGNNAFARLAMIGLEGCTERVSKSISPVVSQYLREASEGQESKIIQRYCDKELMAVLVAETKARYPGKELQIGAGLISLRIVCPLVVTYREVLHQPLPAVQKAFKPSSSSRRRRGDNGGGGGSGGSTLKEGEGSTKTEAVQSYLLSLAGEGGHGGSSSSEVARAPSGQKLLGRGSSEEVTDHNGNDQGEEISEIQSIRRDHSNEEEEEDGDGDGKDAKSIEWGKDMEAVATYLDRLKQVTLRVACTLQYGLVEVGVPSTSSPESLIKIQNWMSSLSPWSNGPSSETVIYGSIFMAVLFMFVRANQSRTDRRSSSGDTVHPHILRITSKERKKETLLIASITLPKRSSVAWSTLAKCETQCLELKTMTRIHWQTNKQTNVMKKCISKQFQETCTARNAVPRTSFVACAIALCWPEMTSAQGGFTPPGFGPCHARNPIQTSSEAPQKTSGRVRRSRIVQKGVQKSGFSRKKIEGKNFGCRGKGPLCVLAQKNMLRGRVNSNSITSRSSTPKFAKLNVSCSAYHYAGTSHVRQQRGCRGYRI
eukprot:jgi/Bigna1/69673/fgenesh1_pg.9_\